MATQAQDDRPATRELPSGWYAFAGALLVIVGSLNILQGFIALLKDTSLGAFITPDLLGGAKSVMIGNLIQNQFAQLNQPFGSALSLILTVAVLLLLAIAMKAGLKASELA